MMKQTLNKNISFLQQQIDNSLETLLNLKLIRFYNPINVEKNEIEDSTRLSWFNHVGGREFASSAFLTIKQYLSILENGSYHALLNDYSIIRVSFTFHQNKLVSQNLLWWPCPVEIDFNDSGEESPIDIINLFLEDVESYRMRSPIRIDFDLSKDTIDHPKAHIHTQHPKSRMNTISPICFNTFVKFIFNHYYPMVVLDNKYFPSYSISYPSTKEISYSLREKLIIA